MNNIERALNTLGRKCECGLTYTDDKKLLNGGYSKYGQNMVFSIRMERRYSVLSIEVNNKHFMKIFKGREHEEDAVTELLAAFRRVEGAAEFFRDYSMTATGR